MSINKVTLLGHVCADPKIITFDNGEKLCSFNLATNEKGYTTKEGHIICDSVEYHRIVLKRAGLIELAEKYIAKGKKLYCEGKIKTRTIGLVDGDIKDLKEIIVDVLELM